MAVENGQAGEFREAITILVDEKGSWKMDFKIPPAAIIFLLEQVKFNILSGQYKINEDGPKLVEPTPSEIVEAS